MADSTTRVEIRQGDKEQGAVAARYGKLETDRMPALTRARKSAVLTIPMLMPPSGHGNSTKYATPYQGVGARGINNLAAKLLLALLPPNHPFFRLQVEAKVLEQLQIAKGEIEEALSTIEQTVLFEINSSPLRVKASEALKQLLVSGNVLIHLTESSGMRVFRMDRYVVKRDPMGNPLEIILKEDVSPSTMEGDVKAAAEITQDGDEPISVFTSIKRDPGSKTWKVSQEINGHDIPSAQGSYPIDKCPWLPLRLIAVDNEDYGRGYVEEYIGDLISLEGLSQAIVEGSAAAAKVLFLVSPNGTTRKKTVVEAANCDVIEGNAEDVTVLQMQKAADFRVALDTAQQITERLSFAFMLNSAVQRGGERVTAEEIRYMAAELEDSLGGIYSVLAQEFQMPLVSLLMASMQRKGAIPALPKGIVKPVVITGMEALGRTQDLQRMDMFIQHLQPLGPETIKQYVSISEYIKRVGASLQVETKGLIRSEEEVSAAAAKQQQQMQMAQMAQAAIPNAVSAMGGMAQSAMDSQLPANQG